MNFVGDRRVEQVLDQSWAAGSEQDAAASPADLAAIDAALSLLADMAADPTTPEVQAVLIDLLFPLLEMLESDPTDARVHAAIARLDPRAAEVAASLLILANFPEGDAELDDLGDGAVLLLAGLEAAAGRRDHAAALLRQSRIKRASPRFQDAAVQLTLLIQADNAGVIQRLFEHVFDDCDHPEIWRALPAVVARFPTLADDLAMLAEQEGQMHELLWRLLHAVCLAAGGEAERGLALLDPIVAAHNHSPFVQGAYFHVSSLLDRDNPAFDLAKRFCPVPFEQLDVLENGSHLCCANWLPKSLDSLAATPWQEVWNSDTAQLIRASIHDGSFRFCNKVTCSWIAGDRLPLKQDVAARSDAWRDVIGNFRTKLPTGPEKVQLAYDATCNLSCPSCRTTKFAADSETRARFDRLQEEQILPMLRHAKRVFITGSGDPFASKNFRNLMDRLGAEDYPELRFLIMTNGMLFTPREWERFAALHGRVANLRISLDAATGPTHELLRRGARWPVMERNLAFVRQLRADRLVDRVELSFTVQVDNFHEMGQAVDLAHDVGADYLSFQRMTNWGTFTPEQYAEKAVFAAAHPRHAEFLEAMQDPRLLDPVAGLHDLGVFVAARH